MRYFQLKSIILVFLFVAGTFICPNDTAAASAEKIDADVRTAMEKLYAKYDLAKMLGEKAKGILVFPSIIKGGFIVGGQYGEGALLKDGKTVAYYNTIQGSYGLQIGLQKHGYALFFMTESALEYITKSEGWELGVGPTITLVDTGLAGSTSTTTLKSDIYAFFVSQTGLMAGIGLQGTKISKISPK